MELWQKILLIVSVSVVVLALIVTLLIVFIKRKKSQNIVEEFPNLLLALGGKENIISASFKGSRVNIEVNDKKLINKEVLKEEVDTIVVSSKKVTMVAGNEKSIKICDYLNKTIDITE